jgi:hypothetical protein
VRTVALFTGTPKTAQHLRLHVCAITGPGLATRAGRPGCRGLPLLGSSSLLSHDRLFLAKLELRLRKDIELEREAPVLVLEGDPRFQ